MLPTSPAARRQKHRFLGWDEKPSLSLWRFIKKTGAASALASSDERVVSFLRIQEGRTGAVT